MNSIEETVNYAYDCLYHQNMVTIANPVCEMRKKIEEGGDCKGRETNEATLYWYMNRSFHQCSLKMQVIPVRGEFCLHFNLIAKQIIFGRWTVLRRICNNPTW